MPVSRTLQRLLCLRALEEEQQRASMESAQNDLDRMEHSRETASERERFGRKLISAGMQSGDLTGMLAGFAETKTGARNIAAMESRIAAQKTEVSARREKFLSTRIERQQTETLLRNAESEQARMAERRGQQLLDDSYLYRIRNKKR